MKTTGPAKEFLLQTVNSSTTDCIIWKYNKFRTGYGSIKYKQKTWSAHRLVCTMVHGDPPSQTHSHAAHSCGVRLCVNPKHLRWATAKENHNDKRIHGTLIFGEKSRNAKLTEREVIEIRKLVDFGANRTHVAANYGVSNQLVSAIGLRQVWKHLP